MGDQRRLLGEERSATHPHSREQTNFATFRHQPLKRAVVGLLGHHGWPFYTEDTFYWLFIYCKQNALLKFVDIKTIPKDKNRVCLTVIDTSIQAPGVDSIAVSEFVNIG